MGLANDKWMLMAARSGAGRGIPVANSQQKCPEGHVKRCRPISEWQWSWRAILISSMHSPCLPWPALCLPIKKSPILLEFTGTDQQGKHDRAPYEAVNWIDCSHVHNKYPPLIDLPVSKKNRRAPVRDLRAGGQKMYASTHYEIFIRFWFSFEKQASEFPLLENLPGMSAYIQRSWAFDYTMWVTGD